MEWKHDKTMYEPLSHPKLHPKIKASSPSSLSLRALLHSSRLISFQDFDSIQPTQNRESWGYLSCPSIRHDRGLNHHIARVRSVTTRRPQTWFFSSLNYTWKLFYPAASVLVINVVVILSRLLWFPCYFEFFSYKAPWFLTVNPTSLQNRQVYARHPWPNHKPV